MGIEFGKILSKSFGYAFNFKRILPFFAVFLVYLGLGLYAFNEFIGLYTGSIGISSIIYSLAGVILGMIVIMTAMFFITLYIKGGIVADAQNYWKGKKAPLSKGFAAVNGKYLSIAGSSILVAIIALISGFIPYVGWIIQLVISWMLLFYLQSIMLNKRKAIDSIKESFYIFMDNKLNVFFIWLVTLIITGVFTAIALIPIMVVAWPLFAALSGALASGGAVPNISMFIQQNIVSLTVAGIIAAIIMAYTSVLVEAVYTFFYDSIKKKRIR